MEVSNEIKKLRLSPMVVVPLLTATMLNLAQTIRGETIVPLIETTIEEKNSETIVSMMDSESIMLEGAVLAPKSVSILENVTATDVTSLTDSKTNYSAVSPETPALIRPVTSEDLDFKISSALGQRNPLVSKLKKVIEADLISSTDTQRQIEVSEVALPETEDLPTSEEIPTPIEPSSSDSLLIKKTSGEEARVLVIEVLVSGVDEDLVNLVYNTVQTRPGRTATRSLLQEDVNAIYATGFFSKVKVSPTDTPLGIRITFDVQANPTLSKVVVVTGTDTNKEIRALPPEVVKDIFEKQYTKILNLRELQNGIQKLNEWYSEQGYDLAQVINSPEVGDDGIVTLMVSEGVIQDVLVRFFDPEDEPLNGRTRSFIVTREMRLKKGNVFNRKIAQTDLQRVFSLGLFEDVRISFSPGEDAREVIVNVDVIEGTTGSLAAGAGISSSSGLFGTISYQEQNLGGNNQTLGGEVQVGERELLFDINFTDPWIAGDPFRTAYTLNAFRRRTISLVFDGDDSSIRTLKDFDSPRVVRTGGGITVARPFGEDTFTPPDWRTSIGFNYQRVQLENAQGDIAAYSAPLNGFPSQPLAFSDSGKDDLFIISFGASQDFRNNVLRPTRGYMFRLGIEQAIPIGSGSIFFTRLRGSYSGFLPIHLLDFGFIPDDQPKPQVLAFNFQFGTVLEDLPPYEAFVIGGSNSVRGYNEGELGNGRSYFQATIEYRFPVIAALGAAIFVDYGTTLKSQRSVRGLSGTIRGLPSDGYGYGLGVRIQSPVGPIRVDYGINNQGDSRLHFGIGERF